MTAVSNFDVVIVGAGPAGCATAISLAGHGLRTLVMDRLVFPRRRPGESLHPGIQPLMAQLGCEHEFLKAGFWRYPGVQIQVDGNLRVERFGSDKEGAWMGFHALRTTFDKILLDRVSEMGVQIWQPCHAKSLSFNNDSVEVDTSCGQVTCRYVVDAAGRNHWLARQHNLKVVKHSPQLLARYGYSYEPHQSASVNEMPLMKLERGSWIWHARIGNDQYHCTSLDLDGNNRTLASQGINVSYERSEDVTWRITDQNAGPSFYIVGDAAIVLDPASSHGVLRAIMSGIMASHSIQNVLIGRFGRAEMADNYNRWLSEWFQHDATRLTELYRQDPAHPQWLDKHVDIGASGNR